MVGEFFLERKMKKNTNSLAKAAIIAALYAVVTLALAPISYGPVQFRVSEAMTILPLFFPEAIVGLTVGCFIANLQGNGIVDIIVGPLATLLAAFITYLIGRKIKKEPYRIILGILPPILCNAFIIPLTFGLITEALSMYFINMLSVLGGEAAVLIILGIPLYYALWQNKYFEK